MATWKEKFNKKYNHPKGTSHSLSDISKETGVSKKGIQQIYNKGIGAYKTNPQSVRPNVTSKEQWAMARVYSSVMGGKASKVDAKELKMEMGGKTEYKKLPKILYHASRDLSEFGGQESSVNKILKNGFKFSGDTKSLTPFSASFFDDKYDAEKFANYDSKNIVAYIPPNDLKILDLDIDDNLMKLYDSSVENGVEYQSLKNLKSFGNYDGIKEELVGQGMEYRIYNPNKLGKENFIPISDTFIGGRFEKLVMSKGGSTDNFDRTDYYKGYYERLSPSNFDVKQNGGQIQINMNKNGAVDIHEEAEALSGGFFKKGGETNFNPDGKIKDKIVHASGDAGGMLVGKRHSNGGIKALNKSTGQPLEMEGGEVVITRDAVSDNKKRSFNGKMMTNRQILSSINESGGGVSFADGGQVPNDLQFDCNAEYEYGGKTMCGKDLAYAMGGVTTAIVTDPNEAMADLQSTYGFGDVYANGGEIKKINAILEKIEDGQRFGLSRYHNARKLKDGSYNITTYPKNEDEGDLSKGIRSKEYKDYTKFKNAVIRILKSPTSKIDSKFAEGGTIECGSCSWSWDRKDGGNDMYVCHKCGTDNEKYFGTDNSFKEDISFKDGGEVKTFGNPLTSEEKDLIKNKAIIKIDINGDTILGIIESITTSYFSLRIIYQENYDIDAPSKLYTIKENDLADILNGKSLSTSVQGTFSYVSNINNIKELSLFQIKTARDILKEYGMYLVFSIPDFFDKVLNTDEPVVDSIRVIEPYNSYKEIYKNYVQGNPISGKYGDKIGFTTNHDNGTSHYFRIGKRKVIVNNDDAYWRIGNGKKIAPYYDWLLSVYGNRIKDNKQPKYNYEKFVSGTNKEYLSNLKDAKEKEKKELNERQLLEATVFNYEKNFSLMNEIAEKGTWKDLGFSKPFDEEKINVEKDYLKLEVNLEMLKVLLPNFQGSKDLIQRKRILKEMKKIQDKINGLGIEINETIANTNDLFTSEGLLNYYFTQSTQSPVLKLDKPCGLPTPNGEKSRLPLSAYLNVRTKEFKNWFGDWEVAYDTNNYNGCSIMIDEDTKEPKIYYHGVAKFRGVRGKGAMGSGVRRPYGAFTPTNFNASYFADNMEYAKFYSGTSDLLPTRFKTDGFVYSLFLNVRNPIDLLPLGLKCSYKNIKDYLLVAYGIDLEYNNVLLEKMDNDINSINNTWQYIRNDELLIERLKDFGYDCIFQVGDIPKYDKKTEKVIGSIEDKEFLTFYPNQVKSVGVLKSFYGNMFDDIRFKKGGYVSI